MTDDPDAEGRRIVLEWLENRVGKDRASLPETLWHYTDPAGLTGILNSNRLWATEARYLNDSMEISHGVEATQRVLAAYRTGGLKPATKRFLAGLYDPERRVLGDYLDQIGKVFVTCFCESGDLLSQWRAYADGGSSGGYAIGFRPRGDLFAWPQAASGGHELSLRRVLYDPVEQERELQDLLKRLIPLLDADPADNDRQRSFGRHLTTGLLEAASWCKHPAFKEEREWRIIYTRTLDPSPIELRHRTGKGLVIPYVELNLPERVGATPETLPIKNINCGPGADPYLKMRGVRSLVGEKPEFGELVVDGSSTPLRW